VDERRLEHLRGLVRDVVATLVPYGSIPPHEAEISLAGDPSYTLPRSENGALRPLVSTLMRSPGWTEKLSESFVSNQLLDLLGSCYATPDESDLRVRDWIAAMEDSVRRQTVYLPVTGIQLQGSPLEVGAVRLVQMTDELLAELLEQHVDAIQAADALEERKSRITARLKVDFDQVRGRCVSIMEVDAESGRAKERAIEETRLALEVLSFCLRPDRRRFERVPRVQGEPEGSYIPVLVLRADGGGFNRNLDAAGPVVDLLVDEEARVAMESAGFAALQHMASAEFATLTDFQKALLRSVHWLVSSLDGSSNEERLLRLVTALECVLTPREGTPIGTAIAEAIALLLQESFEARKDIKKRAKNLYGKRSAVSHGGDKAASDDEVLWLEEVSFGLLQRLIRRHDEFDSRQDLFDYVEELKMGNPATARV
jgi:Apea-like HEPN